MDRENLAPEFAHVPVLFEEAVSSLSIAEKPGAVVVDATLGLGGHAAEIVRRLPKNGTFVGFDRDPANLEAAKRHILEASSGIVESEGLRLEFVESDFRNLETTLDRLGIDGIDAILYDLGVSSAHYDDAERGFSFRFDGPLDMRFNRTDDSPSAEDFVNRRSEAEILSTLREYGEEPKAFFIAKAIVEARKADPIRSISRLLEIIEKASFDPKSKTRVFQALRIAVNDEFGSIESSLRQAVSRLKPEGRISVITFHSLEDRLVKTVLKSFERDVPDPFTGVPVERAQLERVHKKPLEPSEEEVRSNPRSRSAKLRVSQKLPSSK